MYFNRPEFDRYARFNSWGSARETFSWEDLCDIDIELPSLHVQQKYVDIYGYSQFVVGSGFPESAFKATATLDRT